MMSDGSLRDEQMSEGDRGGDGHLLLGVAGLGEDFLERREEVVDVTALARLVHMSRPEVGVLDLLVQAGSNDDVPLDHPRKQIRCLDATRVLDGGHAVCAVLLRVCDKLLEPELFLDELLDSVRCGRV